MRNKPRVLNSVVIDLVLSLFICGLFVSVMYMVVTG